MAKAVPVHVKLSRAAGDTDFLRKTLETLHICAVREAIQDSSHSEQEKMMLCSTIQGKLPSCDVQKVG